MIQGHLLDSWTRQADRETSAYTHAIIVIGALGTPLFLLLAGVAVALSAGSKTRRIGNASAAVNAVARRGLQIFALAFLFRLQAWTIGGSSNMRDLLKVDILNIMGPSIVFAALLWKTGRSVASRCVAFAIVTAATAFVTPLVRMAPLRVLPDPLEAYIVPVAGLSNFVFFPWSGFVFAGAFAGVLIDGVRSDEHERRLNVSFAVAGLSLVFAAYGASHLPSLYKNSSFWTSSPAYFFLRVGLMMLGIWSAYAWTARYVSAGRWSPVIQLGRTSLFIYWIHVELVYGVISRPLHRRLSLPHAWMAYVLFTGMMLVCSVLKDWAVTRIALRRRRGRMVAW